MFISGKIGQEIVFGCLFIVVFFFLTERKPFYAKETLS